MKQFILTLTLISSTITTSPMGKASRLNLPKIFKRFYLSPGHEKLAIPESFYRNMFAQVLADINDNPAAKTDLSQFIRHRLEKTKEAMQRRIAEENNRQSVSPLNLMPCHTDAFLWEQTLLLCGKHREAGTIMLYGSTVALILDVIQRKKHGPAYRNTLKKQFKIIPEQEFLNYFESQPMEGEMKICEEIQTHKMMYRLSKID